MADNRWDVARAYIEKARAHGRSDEAIRAALRRSGWSGAHLDQLLGAAPTAPQADEGGPAAGPARAAAPDRRVRVGRTLSGSFSVFAGNVPQLMLSGACFFLAAVALPILFAMVGQQLLVGGSSVGPALALGNPIAVVLCAAPAFAALCAVLLQVLRGDEARLPAWPRPGLTVLASVGAGLISALAVAIAFAGPFVLIVALVARGMVARGEASDTMGLLEATLSMVVALPFSAVLTVGVALPLTALALPAVADGAGAWEGLGLAFREGRRNWLALIGLVVICWVGTSLAQYPAGFLGSAASAGASSAGPGGMTVLSGALTLVLSLVVVSFAAPWAAALLSSAYLQATGGGVDGES